MPLLHLTPKRTLCHTAANPARSFEVPIEPRHFERKTTISTFESLGLPPALLRAVADLGFTTPTAIQLASIPPALAGADVLASAETGSGKSAAFGLPILNTLMKLPRRKTRALILAPTRELTEQISRHLTLLAKHTDVRVAAVYGGVGFAPQLDAFKRGTDIIVATPGRLLDHLARGTANLDDISILVLDEADRMLDMGFLPVVRRIRKYVRDEHQTLFFSATFPPQLSGLTREMLKNPVRVELAAKAAPVSTLTQTLYATEQQHKTDLFLELLKDNKIYSAICFTRTKSRADRVAAALSKNGIAADLIHGDRSQSQRTRALADFKRGKSRVLVATDIAARGIDIIELGHVVNYDVPLEPEDYIHRIGRTARAQATGDAITFVSSEEEPLIRKIEYILGERLERQRNPLFPEVSFAPPKPSVVYRSRSRRR
ncbi:MAG: RNA helicase [Candidatus Eremiobacter antarcticus]|nr:MAG: RNA helicase [Candidatus Eremiobacteraeota bacterium]PZR64376.1 MAG: RNA helicase [Candidatus Eremiobacter sp. RRmetagenome_bin22]